MTKEDLIQELTKEPEFHAHKEGGFPKNKEANLGDGCKQHTVAIWYKSKAGAIVSRDHKILEDKEGNAFWEGSHPKEVCKALRESLTDKAQKEFKEPFIVGKEGNGFLEALFWEHDGKETKGVLYIVTEEDGKIIKRKVKQEDK